MSGRSSINNSGFNGVFSCPLCDNDTSGITEITNGYDYPDSKYYDVYKYGTDYTNYTRRILGDATGELGPFVEVDYTYMGSWYSERSESVSTLIPWFARGGGRHNGFYSGTFASAGDYGRATSHIGFRITLTPAKNF